MWQALGALLPIAVAVAVSSVPITVTILLLLSPNRSKTALPFLIGWVIGVMAVMGGQRGQRSGSTQRPPPSSGRSDRSSGALDRSCVDRARRRSDTSTFSRLRQLACRIGSLRSTRSMGWCPLRLALSSISGPKACFSVSRRASPSMRRQSTTPNLPPSSSSIR